MLLLLIKVLEDLYKPYGRTQEGDLAEIDTTASEKVK